MAARHPSRFWRICRVYFRRFRIAVWLAILILVAAFTYLNQVGLPGFVKKPLIENLRSRGLDVSFSRLRLRWYRGLVAENVRFVRSDELLSPSFAIGEVQVRLNRPALARLQLQVDSLVLREGRLVWPVAETNKAPRELAVENIQTDLRFLPNDEWALDHFTAGFAGANIHLSGTLTNASAVREWKFFQARQSAPAGVWQNRLRDLADTLERIHFSAPPELKLDVCGDARDLQSFTVRMTASAPGADTPWAKVAGGRFTIRIYPTSADGLSRADLDLEADETQTPWARTANMRLAIQLASLEGFTSYTNLAIGKLANGDLSLGAAQVQTKWASATNLQLTVHAKPVPGQTNLVNASLALQAGTVGTPWGSTTNARLSAQWIHALTNAIPISGEGRLDCSQAAAKWASAGGLRLNVRLATSPGGGSPRADASWAAWAGLEPYVLDWDVRATNALSHRLAVREVACSGNWRAPGLVISNLVARIDREQVTANAALDVASRALKLGFSSNLDPHRLAPLLPDGSERWLAEFACEQPPELNGEIALTLPAWTNRPPGWEAELRPTVRLQGGFDFKHGGTFKGVALSAARSHLVYSNGLLRLPDLNITRPEGRLDAAIELNGGTKEYAARIQSGIDVLALRPALDPGQRGVFDLFTFTLPPALQAEVRGCWQQADRIGIRGSAAITNFTFRGESISSLQTAFQYTNRFALITAPRVQCGPRQASADALGVDLVTQRIHLTNGFSTVEPMVVARAIGEQIVSAIEPYRFDEPPVAHVHGIIPLRGEEDADLHFELAGGPFHWWRFNVPQITGHVHWRGQHLSLSDVRVGFYGGQATGAAVFDFHPGAATDYQFTLTTTNTEAESLIADLFRSTNILKGSLSGSLFVTNADTSAMETWRGFGNLQLQNGLIWDIPVFGMFSDVLNGLAPGLGSSRASAGTCTFGITNGVIRSNDLDIRSTAVRLQYRGTVDFESRVKARVEAGLLRDVWLVGPVVSTVFWPVTKVFEYKVSGTLGEPKAEPVFLIPKVMLLPFQMPFHPLRTLKGLLPEDSGDSRTNNPALSSPKQN